MKNVCIKRPSVLKHFRQLLLEKNSDAIRVLLEAPDFFDNDPLESIPIDNASSDESESAQYITSSNDDDRIRSLQEPGSNTVDYDDLSTVPRSTLDW
eukprot:CAMPEP_0176492420 /NCGR_PEP_ID=MMETSP0200_2-20121128/8986_1 /TAXON_ID=947934 /ORGANISM="Chaetoceros sp., Strain GSL56" /LENGTH=96 /DNA_ID=CAMNT_0017889975 /DNA_START=99 /DNA_END=389 /DNA_ORIENTATION=-